MSCVERDREIISTSVTLGYHDNWTFWLGSGIGGKIDEKELFHKNRNEEKLLRDCVVDI